MNVIFTVENNEGPGSTNQYINGIRSTQAAAEELFKAKFDDVLRYHIPERHEDPDTKRHLPYGESSLDHATPIFRCCAEGWWWGIFEVVVP